MRGSATFGTGCKMLVRSFPALARLTRYRRCLGLTWRVGQGIARVFSKSRTERRIEYSTFGSEEWPLRNRMAHCFGVLEPGVTTHSFLYHAGKALFWVRWLLLRLLGRGQSDSVVPLCPRSLGVGICRKHTQAPGGSCATWRGHATAKWLRRGGRRRSWVAQP